MSDDEDEFMSEESYEFEFEDDDASHSDNLEEEQPDHSIENRYYNAKALKDESDQEALRELEAIVKDHRNEYEWVFKALKQIIKINFKLNNYDSCLQYLRQLILVIPHIKHNYADESLTRMVNNYSVCRNNEFVHEFYNTLLNGFETSSNNNRLWLKIMISKLSLFLDNQQYSTVPSLIESIKDKLNKIDPESKGLALTYLPEVCAHEIEYFFQQKPLNINKLRQLHKDSLRVATVLTHPRVLGIIKECGGKLNFYRGNFEKARLEFYEAFKCYDEVGFQQKNQILKYVILCSIVTDHEVNPFESQETQAYALLSDYENLVALYDAFEGLNLKRMQLAIQSFALRGDALANDDIFLKSANIILNNMKSKILVRILGSFQNIRFKTLTTSLEITTDDLDKRITNLVSEGTLSDIVLNYNTETIHTGITPNRILPVSVSSILTSAQILDGMKLFETFELAALMKIDVFKSPYSTLPCILYNFGDGEYLDDLSEWLQVVATGVPTKLRLGLSQKDQVLYELAVDSANNGRDEVNSGESHNSSRAVKSTNAGILGSALTIKEEEEEEEDQVEEDTNRPEIAVKQWCAALEDRYRTLLTTGQPEVLN